MTSFILFVLLLINIAISFVVFLSQSSKYLLSISSSLLVLITEYMGLALIGAKFDTYLPIVFLLSADVINLIIAFFFRKSIWKIIKNPPKIKILPICYIVTLVLVLSTIILTNGLFGMGQDQGVYQVKALALSGGYQGNVVTLEEENEFFNKSHIAEANNDFASFANIFYVTQTGFYTDISQEGEPSLSGVFHGIPTYPALLALDVDLFGISGMLNINYALVFISFVFLLEIIENLKLNKFLGTIVLLISLASPVVIWVNKSSLTETVQISLMIAILSGIILSSKKHRLGLVITTVASLAFSLVHLSAIYYLPIVGVLLVVNAIRTDDAFAIWCNQIITASYVFVFYLENKICSTYVYNNLTSTLNILYGKAIVHETFVKFIFAMAICMSLATLIFLIPVIRKIGRILLDSIVYRILLLGILLLSLWKTTNTFLDYSKMYGKKIAVASISWDGIALSTGIILLPIVIVLFVLFINKLLKNSDFEAVVILFMYVTLFVTCFTHPIIFYYHYYGRYLASGVFLVPLLFGIIANNYIKNKPFQYVISAIALLVIAPFSIFASVQRDDTGITLKQFESFVEHFEEGDAVVFAGENRKLLLLATKFASGADVYNEFVQKYELNKDYNNVYQVVMDDAVYEGATLYDTIEVDCSNDLMETHRFIFPLFDYDTVPNSIKIYKCDFDPEVVVSYEASNLRLNGFQRKGPATFWSTSEFGYINFYVPDTNDSLDAYIYLSEFNSQIPEEYLANNIYVYINDELITNIHFFQAENQLVISSDKLVKGAFNKIAIGYSLWPDTSSGNEIYKGFAISRIDFK